MKTQIRKKSYLFHYRGNFTELHTIILWNKEKQIWESTWTDGGNKEERDRSYNRLISRGFIDKNYLAFGSTSDEPEPTFMDQTIELR